MSLLRIENVTKVYPGTVALDDVSCSFKSGEVSAVIGKNGSGKSTLIKLISGAISPTSGNIYLDDEKLSFSGPAAAYKKGIATVYQELSLTPSLSIAENIYMGRLTENSRFVNWKKLHAKTEELLQSMNIDLMPTTLVHTLPMWQRQMIEIVKAISHEPKVIMLDEPTSALHQQESEMLFEFIRELKQKDIIILYISHRLHELWKIADNCSVLKDGKLAGQVLMKDATHKMIVDMMLGEVEVKPRPDDLATTDETVLEVKNLSYKNRFNDISFSLKKGEILGIAGMLGSGRTELLSSIFGAAPFDSGSVFVNGEEVKKPTPKIMKNKGLAMTQEDRKHKGLSHKHSVATNLVMASLNLLSKKGIIDRKAEAKAVETQFEDLEIKASSPDEYVTSLSGGNQQKVVVGNWLNAHPNIILFDEPSRGIDVGAKQQIFQVMWKLSKQGISSVMVSSELEELIEVCERIIIMRDGELVGEEKASDLTVDELYLRCMGGN